MSRTERDPGEAREIMDAMARQATPMHGTPEDPGPDCADVGHVVHFIFEAIREYEFPFGIYNAQPPITPSVRHVNRTRHGQGWTDPPQRAA